MKQVIVVILCLQVTGVLVNQVMINIRLMSPSTVINYHTDLS